MNSLFSNQAVKRSLGWHTLAGIEPLQSIATSTAAPAHKPEQEASTSTSKFQPTLQAEQNLEEALYESRAQAKIHTSMVAMHMDDVWRRSLYRQLDSLLDIDEWLEGEAPLATTSFATFLRLMLLIRPQIRPGLGLTSKGNLVASWATQGARLSIECMPNDVIRYLLSHEFDDRHESVAGDSIVERAPDVIAPFNPGQWFDRVAAEPA